MKNRMLLAGILYILSSSCSKNQNNSSSAYDQATILQVKYACGATCNATAWILKTHNGVDYEPVNLPESFKVYDLDVTVLYRKTGQRADPGQGTGEEKVEILEIIKR